MLSDPLLNLKSQTALSTTAPITVFSLSYHFPNIQLVCPTSRYLITPFACLAVILSPSYPTDYLSNLNPITVLSLSSHHPITILSPSYPTAHLSSHYPLAILSLSYSTAHRKYHTLDQHHEHRGLSRHQNSLSATLIHFTRKRGSGYRE